MLRKAPVQKLPKAVAAVVSEGVATSDVERVHGSAQLLAVSVLGPSYTLHSRAEPLLSALFSMTSLKADSRFLIPGVLLALEPTVYLLSGHEALFRNFVPMDQDTAVACPSSVAEILIGMPCDLASFPDSDLFGVARTQLGRALLCVLSPQCISGLHTGIRMFNFTLVCVCSVADGGWAEAPGCGHHLNTGPPAQSYTPCQRCCTTVGGLQCLSLIHI